MRPDFRLTTADFGSQPTSNNYNLTKSSSLEFDMAKNLTLPNHAGHLRRAELSRALLDLNEVSERLDELHLTREAQEAVDILESLAEKL